MQQSEEVCTHVLVSVSVYHFKEAIFCHLALTWADLVGTGKAWNIWIAFRLFIKTGSPLWPVFHTSFNPMDWCQVRVCACVAALMFMYEHTGSCTHITVRRKDRNAVTHPYARTQSARSAKAIHCSHTWHAAYHLLPAYNNWPHEDRSELVCSFAASFRLSVAVGSSGPGQKNSMWPGGGD